MIKYFVRQYWRYIAMALAFATITFIANSCEVKAETGIQTTVLNYTGNTYNRNVRIFSNNNNIYSNWGRSYITFTTMIQTTDPSATLYPIEQISVFSSNNIFICKIGNTNLNFGESDGKILVYDVACDTNLGSNGIKAIDVTLTATDGVFPIHITTSQYMTVYQNLDLNISQVLQQQQAITQGYLNTIHSSIDLNGQYIVSAIQALQSQQIQAINNNTQAVNGVNDSINDSTTDDPSNDLNDMTQNQTSNSVISDLLLLPVTLFQNILNAISGTCNSFNLGNLFNSNLTLPCINIKNYLGNSLYNVIDVIISGIFVLSIRKKFVDVFQNITSLKDRGNELE